MASRNSSGVARRHVSLDGNRPPTHPKHSGRETTKFRPASAEGDDRPKRGEVFERLSRALTGCPTTHTRVDGQAVRTGGEL
jgi:hypothetical protein